MPPAPPQPVQLTCPVCGTNFRTGLYTLVDVGAQPELKAALLSGQLNVAVCPNCRTASMLGAPLIYHDPARQLCLVYFPQELSASPQDQERFVGEATSFILRSLPPEAPRAYLLSPRRFLTLPSLLDAILEADGVSREMLDQQRQRVDLISELAGVVAEGGDLAAAIEPHRPELTPEFFATLSAFIEATPASQADSRQLLIQLNNQLAELLGLGGEADPEAEAELAAAVDALIDTPDEELAQAVASRRELIDYDFFSLWTARIERAEADGRAEEAARLSARRAAILELVEEIDAQAQAMFEAGSGLLQEVLSAPDAEAAMRERADRIDETFMVVLSANAAAAQRAGQAELVERLEQLADLATTIVQERMTPEERFINELLMAETPQEATRMLRKSVAKITPELVRVLNELATQEETRANKPVADRLRQLAREAGAMLF